MIETDEKYADGGIVYLHDCYKCGKENSARGRKNAKNRLCNDCIYEKRVKNIKKTMPSKKHGYRYHALYETWKNIRRRCFDQKNKKYKYYGGRGITMHPLFKDNAEVFIKYIENLPHCYEEKRTLDRVDNNANYEPMNLRWATAKEQNNNQRYKKNETGYPYIQFNKAKNSKQKYRVTKYKRAYTLEEALRYRKEKYGF